MSFTKAETDVTADKSFLSKAPGKNSSEADPNLLNETNQSFPGLAGKSRRPSNC